jgi:hypothetical protein
MNRCPYTEDRERHEEAGEKARQHGYRARRGELIRVLDQALALAETLEGERGASPPIGLAQPNARELGLRTVPVIVVAGFGFTNPLLVSEDGDLNST